MLRDMEMRMVVGIMLKGGNDEYSFDDFVWR